MRWIAVALCVLVVAGLAWIGGELHYRNCINTASDRVTAKAESPDEAQIREISGGGESAVDRQVRALRRGCSRLPI